MYGSTIIWSSLTKPSAAHFSAAACSPKNRPVSDAQSQPGEDLSREGHEAVDRKSKKTTASAGLRVGQILPNYRQSPSR